MAVLSPPYSLGATGLQHTAKLDRLSLGASWRPASAALAAVGGALWGPPGSMGELSLVNPTTLRVAAALWVVQGTHFGSQGQYLVPNDAAADLAITAQHASQFRRNLVAVTVDDSEAAGVASSPTTDRARVHLIEGALAAAAPAPLSAVPANTLLLGEVAIPPIGQTVTLTAYNPRTTSRGGIQPVIDDAQVIAGHAGEAGAYVGQYRDHPVRGLERWDGGAWRDPNPWIGYTPAWATTGSAPAVNNGVLTGRYRRSGRLVEVDIYLRFGSTTGGGTGEFRFSLPFQASTDREHMLACKSFSAVGDHVGYALISTGGTVAIPYLPVSNSATNLAQARNVNAAGTAGTGVPAASPFPFATGHVLQFAGRYEANL